MNALLTLVCGCRRYSQKPLLRREISNGLYHYSSFFIAKSLTSLPFQFMFAAIFNGSVYFLVSSLCQPTYFRPQNTSSDGPPRCLFSSADSFV